ncbi:MAG: hypothetical protein K0S27_228 [Gammaproteobacteria bacterium]|jgi:arylsulfatase A-like enzyme|nr:hypothetical protein [Gammaproteobacteria bacterium]
MKIPQTILTTPLSQQKRAWLFIYLFALTSFFLLLEISFFIQASNSYLDVFKEIAYHLKIPTQIFPGVAYFLAMQLLIHIAYVFFIAYLAIFISFALDCTQAQVERLGLTLGIMGLFLILLANHHFYPDSKFSILISDLVPDVIQTLCFIILLMVFSLALVLALYGLYKSNKTFCIIGVFLISAFTVWYSHFPTARISAATASKPNIIIIGVDAVRPDFLGYFGGGKHTPHLDNFLNQAAVFSESLTPLARTYPAWVSILTGQYPKKNGVRFDLTDQMHFDLYQTLPAILQRQGYHTVYATDETRFSNIDQRFGFDHLVTPPIGFNDFLLGSLNDFPFSNLLVNTFLGRYLFPYSYGNRPAYITYEPATFLNLLKPALIESHTQPLFLAIHFCLTHYPYLWAGRPTNGSSLHNYQQAIHRADQQVEDLLKLLKKNRLLEHSIVILLSDHGEALELKGDRVTEPDLFISKMGKPLPRFYPQSESKEEVNQSAGHGTDVLGLTQYHTLLAFRFFNGKKQTARLISGRVSLLDIKPTLLNLLHVPDKNSEGQSLLDAISGKKLTVPRHVDFFTETDFTPEAIRSVNPETRKVLFEGIEYIQINPKTTRLSIRPSMMKWILSSKQYADFYGDWVLALYPQTLQWMMPVLVNLETGIWTTDLHTDFAKHAPLHHMLQALKHFYGKDITRIEASLSP